MWSKYKYLPIIYITNAQNWTYWADKQLYKKLEEGDNFWWDDRKRYLKKRSFEIVADQTGRLMNPIFSPLSGHVVSPVTKEPT
jgi:starch phosphorylase